MICWRYLENRGFLPADYWQARISLRKDGVTRQFHRVGNLKRKEEADSLGDRLKVCPQARIVRVERKTTHEAPPLLFDLTALQKECNLRFDMSAEDTLSVAQSLYEKKLISYPRTGSRYIPSDMARFIPSLLKMILRMEAFSHFADKMNPLCPSNRSVDGGRVTDHHALVITGDYPRKLTPTEEKVYRLIAGRMLESFGPRCEKETMLVEAAAEGELFRSRSAEILSAGWRGVYNHPEEAADGGDEICSGNMDFVEDEAIAVSGIGIVRCKTRPKPIHTEATLLSAMETAGRQVEDEKAREAMLECGIGTPATRAAIIETLLARGYIERSGKSVVPTEKGLYVYNSVKDMRIADAGLTGDWERSLAEIERGAMKADSFMRSMEEFTRRITKEVLSVPALRLPSDAVSCPKCGARSVLIRHRLAKCDNDKCGFVLYRRFLNKTLTDEQMRSLIKSRKTRPIKGFEGKTGKRFDARLRLDDNFNVSFLFPEEKPKSESKPAKSGSRNKPSK